MIDCRRSGGGGGSGGDGVYRGGEAMARRDWPASGRCPQCTVPPPSLTSTVHTLQPDRRRTHDSLLLSAVRLAFAPFACTVYALRSYSLAFFRSSRPFSHNICY